MLSRFRIQSFKIIGELELALDRLTVLVGPNACGKSSVLQAMWLLCAMKKSAPQELFTDRWRLDELTTRGARQPLLLEAGAPGFQLTWCANNAGEDERDANAMPWLSWKSGEHEAEREELWGAPLRDRHGECASALPDAERFRFEFDDLAAPAVVSASPVLGASGRGLAAVLGHLALEYPEDFQRIKRAALAVITSIQDIRLRNIEVRQSPPSLQHSSSLPQRPIFDEPRPGMPAHELLFDTRSGRSIPAHAMSDGTLRVLALLTVALGRNSPKLLLLDDVERGIHPRAMVELVRLLQNALEEDPELQIVATTHSPDLLDELAPHRVRLLWLGEDGLTRCVAMNDHPEFDAWRAIMTPGEMWAVFDRDNQGAS